MNTYIVADIGGTQIRAAVFQARNPNPVVIKKIRTRDKAQTPEERLITLIREIWPKGVSVTGIVVAVPGYLDINNGVVVEAPNVPGWIDLPIQGH